MHYSQKRRYYFFIAIAKFKTILSYYPLAGASFPPTAYPSLNLRSTFAYDCATLAPHLRHTCATLAPHLRHTCATHFGKLSEFAKVNRPPLAQVSPPMLILRHILSCASSLTFLRLSFAQGSMRRILNFELMGLLGLGEVMF